VRHPSNSSLIRWQLRLTVERLRAASAPRTSAKAASMSRSDRPRTQPEITSDSNALVLVTPAPNNRGAERLVGGAQLGTLQLHGAHGGLHRRRRLPAVADAGSVLLGGALVAGPPQELLDLGLQGGLQQQPHAQAGHLLKDRGQVTIGREQLVDLGAGALGG
jgi:hypothetical protein